MTIKSLLGAVSLALLLVFIWDGYLTAVRWWGRDRVRLLVRATAVLAFAIPIATASGAAGGPER